MTWGCEWCQYVHDSAAYQQWGLSTWLAEVFTHLNELLSLVKALLFWL